MISDSTLSQDAATLPLWQRFLSDISWLFSLISQHLKETHENAADDEGPPLSSSSSTPEWTPVPRATSTTAPILLFRNPHPWVKIPASLAQWKWLSCPSPGQSNRFTSPHSEGPPLQAGHSVGREMEENHKSAQLRTAPLRTKLRGVRGRAFFPAHFAGVV